MNFFFLQSYFCSHCLSGRVFADGRETGVQKKKKKWYSRILNLTLIDSN